jgi:hypothetical protein
MIKFSDATKQYFWGAVGGALVLAMVTSSWDLMLTRGAVEQLGKKRAAAAVAQALAPYCVERFQSQKDASAKLAELKKQDQYQQGTFIEKGGWATPPGSSAPNSDVAKVCAEMLTKAR